MADRNEMCRAKLMRRIQQHGFAMVEANLYLDGHPNCRRALEYFDRQRCAYNKYVAEYETTYGPLTIMNAGSGKCGGWNWVQGPWPWEREAN